MKHTRPLAFSICAAVLWTMVPASAAEKIGVNAAVKGDVYVRGANEENQRRAVINDAVKLGDELDSKKKSALQILLLDETVFTVGADCVMTIDEFVYDPNAKAGKMAASVAKGTFRFVTGRIGANNPKDVSITTPTATIGVRGTIIETTVGPDAIEIAKLAGLIGPDDEVDPEHATIIVLRGPGPNNNTLNKDGNVDIETDGGKVTLTNSATAVFIPFEGAEPSDPFVFTADMDALIGRWLRQQPSPQIANLFDQNKEGDEEEDSSGSNLSGQNTASGENNQQEGGENGDPNYEGEQTEDTAPIEEVEDPDPEVEPDPEPLHTGVFNYQGDEISNFSLVTAAEHPVMFVQNDVPLYEDTGSQPELHNDNQSINVVVGPYTVGDPQVGSYDFSVTIDPAARSYTSDFSFEASSLDLQGEQTVDGFFGTSGNAFLNPYDEGHPASGGTTITETGACDTGTCLTYIDMLISGDDPIGGVAHSLKVTHDVGEASEITIRGAGKTYDGVPLTE